MQYLKNHPLKDLNTFGITAIAREYVAVRTVAELQQVLAERRGEAMFILGGGSNMLLTRDIDALVIHICITGKQIISEDNGHALVRANAGENWHEFVLWTIEHDLGGLENMSLIPGNVGTTPIQNIGAYGKEIKDTFVCCEAVEISTGKLKEFSKEDCNFGYRESVFKHELKDQYIITSVVFRLTSLDHVISTSYGDITKELGRQNITQPTLRDVSRAVIAIRSSKLPDPKELGNSGSFFKNPIIPKTDYEHIRQKFPDMPHYEVSDAEVKVPAGWLIEHAGFKGSRFGDAGVHQNQALVLVNYGGASGSEILDLSRRIQKTIVEKFGIEIEAEVNIV